MGIWPGSATPSTKSTTSADGNHLHIGGRRWGWQRWLEGLGGIAGHRPAERRALAEHASAVAGEMDRATNTLLGMDWYLTEVMER
jgi:hypothetical protein